MDGGRDNPSCANHQNITFSGGQAFFCRMKGRYVVITIDSEKESKMLHVSEMLVNPSHQSKQPVSHI